MWTERHCGTAEAAQRQTLLRPRLDVVKKVANRDQPHRDEDRATPRKVAHVLENPDVSARQLALPFSNTGHDHRSFAQQCSHSPVESRQQQTPEAAKGKGPRRLIACGPFTYWSLSGPQESDVESWCVLPTTPSQRTRRSLGISPRPSGTDVSDVGPRADGATSGCSMLSSAEPARRPRPIEHWANGPFRQLLDTD
jgi:hypothetical protein